MAEHDEVDRIVDVVAALEPTFGGINLEDIKAPECFEVEARLLHTSDHAVHVGVHVRSGDPATGELQLTTFCRTVFVVLDGQTSRSIFFEQGKVLAKQYLAGRG